MLNAILVKYIYGFHKFYIISILILNKYNHIMTITFRK